MNRLLRRYVAAFVLIAASIVCVAIPANAQTSAVNVAGRWEGALDTGQAKLRLVLDISKASDGVLTGTLTSVDQGGALIPIERIEFDGNLLRLDVKAVSGNFEGSISKDKKRITGTWTQGISLPLEFIRAAVATKPVTSSVFQNAEKNGFASL